MNSKERAVVSLILISIFMMVSLDLLKDSAEGVVFWHLMVEGAIALFALLGVFYLILGQITLKHALEKEKNDFREFKKEALVWRAESKKYVEGLSKAIDQQLTKWNLSLAEKEVAFLLLKGLSLKEIAQIRDTTEKTARVQSMAIYHKAGLASRSELSAFFLEDLLLPSVY